MNDDLEGVLFSVNDVSGVPILTVNSNDSVVMGTFNSDALVVSGDSVGIGTGNPTNTLTVVGDSNPVAFVGLSADPSASGIQRIWIL